MTGKLTKGQQDYEQRRAAKAGMSLDKWLDAKRKQQEVAAREEARARKPAADAKKAGLLTRLLDRAHKPIGKKA